jgi:hypothetical protein
VLASTIVCMQCSAAGVCTTSIQFTEVVATFTIPLIDFCYPIDLFANNPA